MGLIINPRGASGAGTTWLVRQIMAACRWDGAEAVPLRRAGRPRPMGWRLVRPGRGRPVAVVGHYGAVRGGTDTIPSADGGLDAAVRMAGDLAGDGHDVLLEGSQFSGDVARTAALARAQQARGGALHVLRLDTPLDRCVRNVVARRRAGRAARSAIERTARDGQAAAEAACRALRDTGAVVEVLDAAAALRRALALLGLEPARPGGEAGPPRGFPLPGTAPAPFGGPSPSAGAS